MIFTNLIWLSATHLGLICPKCEEISEAGATIDGMIGGIFQHEDKPIVNPNTSKKSVTIQKA
jgi:hypothetical protein